MGVSVALPCDRNPQQTYRVPRRVTVLETRATNLGLTAAPWSSTRQEIAVPCGTYTERESLTRVLVSITVGIFEGPSRTDREDFHRAVLFIQYSPHSNCTAAKASDGARSSHYPAVNVIQNLTFAQGRNTSTRQRVFRRIGSQVSLCQVFWQGRGSHSPIETKNKIPADHGRRTGDKKPLCEKRRYRERQKHSRSRVLHGLPL